MLRTEEKKSNHDSSEHRESLAEGLKQYQCANAVPCLHQPLILKMEWDLMDEEEL